jgi:hypothetical protein
MDPLQLAALYQSYKSVLPEAVKNKIEDILGDKITQEQPESEQLETVMMA